VAFLLHPPLSWIPFLVALSLVVLVLSLAVLSWQVPSADLGLRLVWILFVRALVPLFLPRWSWMELEQVEQLAFVLLVLS